MQDPQIFIAQGLDVERLSDTEALRYYQDHPYVQNTELLPTSVATRKLAHWLDPLTPPQLKNDCVKWCHITPHDKWCCGWALRKRWMYCDLYLEIRTLTPEDIIDAIESCLREATIASALAGIIAALGTGGGGLAAAESTFIAVLTPCLQSKLKDITSNSYLTVLRVGIMGIVHDDTWIDNRL